MKLYRLLLGICLLLLGGAPSSFAQFVGTDCYIQGAWVEIGLVNNASFGTESHAPAGYYPNSGWGGIGELYDYGHDGWTVGTPPYMGDYTLPGSPFEGWEIQINGLRNQAYQSGGYTGSCGPCGTLTSTGPLTYTSTSTAATCDWAGTAASGGLIITQSTVIDTFGSYVKVTTKFYNTTGAVIPDVYYERSADPDNDEYWGGSFATYNHIQYQNDADHRVLVTATGHTGGYTMWGLGTKDCRAVCFIYSSWPLSGSVDLSTIWTQTYGPADYTLGSDDPGDIGIGLVYNLGNIGANDSAVISYAYIFGADAAAYLLDSSFPDPEIVTEGVAHDSVDTVIGCNIIGASSFPATIINGTTGGWSWSHWTWAPAVGLSATTGTSVTVNLLGISGPVTYTITGTDTATGSMTDCNEKVFLLYVTPCFHATNNGPICLNDTLFLVGHGDSTGATYFWWGPGGYTAFTQKAFRTGLTMADTGWYYVVKTVGIEHDTVSTHVALKAVPYATVTSNAPVCSGTTLSFSATPDSVGETFAWTGPDGFTSALEYPSVTTVTTQHTGLYKLVTQLNGCFDSSYISVFVDSTPAIPSVGNNSPLCSQRSPALTITSGDATPGVSYTWAGPLGFTSTMEDVTFNDPSTNLTGVYTITAYINYDDLICSSNNSTSVYIDSTPVVPTMRSNSPVCSGTTLIDSASDTAGSLYSWVGPNYFVSNLQYPSIGSVITAATGIYSVTATVIYTIPSTIGCVSDTGTMFAQVDSTPVIPVAGSNSPGTPSICQGDTLRIVSSDATSPVAFSWAGPNAFTSTDENPVINGVLPAATGDYTVTVIYNGISLCPSATVITVSITPTPALSVTSNSPVCTGVGDTLFLKAISDPTATFNWSGPYVFRSTAQYPFRDPVIPEYGGIYKVTAYLNGCASAEVSDTVVVNQTPDVPWVKWVNYCLGHPAPALQASGDSILWYASGAPGGVGTLTPPIPSTSALGNTFYYATQTLNGCTSGVDSIQVSVFPSPTVSVSRDTVACPNDSILLTAVDPDLIAYYHWVPSIYLSDTSKSSTMVRPETNVTYSVIVTNEFGCMDTATVAVTVQPAAVLSLGDSVQLYPGQSYQINTLTNCSSFTWFPPSGLDNPYISAPTATPLLSTKYIVYGITEWGCKAEDSIDIYVTTQSLFAVPNAFTPGAGPNNVFKVLLQGEATLTKFTVFDRWGVKVFETSDINAGWDGTFNSTNQPQGVYIYQIEAVSSSGQTFTKTGNVTLIR